MNTVILTLMTARITNVKMEHSALMQLMVIHAFAQKGTGEKDLKAVLTCMSSVKAVFFLEMLIVFCFHLVACFVSFHRQWFYLAPALVIIMNVKMGPSVS